MALTPYAISVLLSREQTDPFIVLLTIEHPELGAPIRVARNVVGEDIVSRGETFQAFPFDIDLASDTENAPVARIVVMNADRRVGDALQRIKTACTCSFELVLASTPDIVEKRYARFRLRNVIGDALTISGDLLQFEGSSEPWPYKRVLPSLFPAIFRL